MVWGLWSGPGSGVHGLGQALGSGPGSWLGSGVRAGPGDRTEGVESFPPRTSVAFQHLLLHPRPRPGLQQQNGNLFSFSAAIRLPSRAGRPLHPDGGHRRVSRVSLATGQCFIRGLRPGARGPFFLQQDPRLHVKRHQSSRPPGLFSLE